MNLHAKSNAGFDPNWLHNAVEEVLDEANVEANMRLE